ncbi:hypothetical protein ID866_10148 [Astraeus odoratus]|nr:hypothetical protein ID866_10148 [Astraeus odoratus]
MLYMAKSFVLLKKRLVQEYMNHLLHCTTHIGFTLSKMTENHYA